MYKENVTKTNVKKWLRILMKNKLFNILIIIIFMITISVITTDSFIIFISTFMI